MIKLHFFNVDKEKRPHKKMRRLKNMGIFTINYRPKCYKFINFFIITFVIVLALNFDQITCQDGSSEITPDKTMSVLGAKLKVRCTDDSLK